MSLLVRDFAHHLVLNLLIHFKKLHFLPTLFPIPNRPLSTMRTLWLFSFFLMLWCSVCTAATFTHTLPYASFVPNDSNPALEVKQNNIGGVEEYPKVFLISEDFRVFEKLSSEYPSSLLDVYSYDMDKSYKQWMTMLHSMETYAERINYDIRGVKIWIKVYWAADGSIDYIGYCLKPNSRFMRHNEFSAFLKGFMATSHQSWSVTPTTKFSHYASASFPTFYKPEGKP